MPIGGIAMFGARLELFKTTVPTALCGREDYGPEQIMNSINQFSTHVSSSFQ